MELLIMDLCGGDPRGSESVLGLEREEAERWRYVQMASNVNEKIRIYKSTPPGK